MAASAPPTAGPTPSRASPSPSSATRARPRSFTTRGWTCSATSSTPRSSAEMDTRLDGRRADAEAAPRQLLPIEAYTSEEWLRHERKSLFARSWLFAGMIEDLPRPGSYRCLDAGAAPLVLLRDQEGRLRAFHNVCRHRGARLLEGEGT